MAPVHGAFSQNLRTRHGVPHGKKYRDKLGGILSSLSFSLSLFAFFKVFSSFSVFIVRIVLIILIILVLVIRSHFGSSHLD